MKIKLFLVAVFSIFLIGCQSGPRTPLGYEGPLQRTEAVEMNSVIFVDHELNRTYKGKLFGETKQIIKVSVDSQGIRTTDGGTAEVWVLLRNHTDYPVQIEGRTMFFDSGMAPVDAKPLWKRVFIPANSLATYKESTYSGDISYYRVELKEGS